MINALLVALPMIGVYGSLVVLVLWAAKKRGVL
jgi:hypothetical protein